MHIQRKALVVGQARLKLQRARMEFVATKQIIAQLFLRFSSANVCMHVCTCIISHRRHEQRRRAEGLPSVLRQEPPAQQHHAAHGRHPGDGVGHRHERGVERRSDAVHQLVAPQARLSARVVAQNIPGVV